MLTPSCGSSPVATSSRSGAASTNRSDGCSWPVWIRASRSSAATSRASRAVSRSMWPRKRSRSAGTSFAPSRSTSRALLLGAVATLPRGHVLHDQERTVALVAGDPVELEQATAPCLDDPSRGRQLAEEAQGELPQGERRQRLGQHRAGPCSVH